MNYGKIPISVVRAANYLQRMMGDEWTLTIGLLSFRRKDDECANQVIDGEFINQLTSELDEITSEIQGAPGDYRSTDRDILEMVDIIEDFIDENFD